MKKVFLLGFILSLADSVVTMIEAKYPSAAGPSKRAAAFKYIRDRIRMFEMILGPLGGAEIPDSLILGAIDGAVQHKNFAGEFKKASEERHYAFPKALQLTELFEWPNPETGKPEWVRTDSDGAIVTVPTKLSDDGQTRIPIPVVAGEEDPAAIEGEDPPIPAGHQFGSGNKLAAKKKR